MRKPLPAILLAFSVFLSGCGDGKQKSPMQKAGDAVGGAVDSVKEAGKKKADSVEKFATDRLKVPE